MPLSHSQHDAPRTPFETVEDERAAVAELDRLYGEKVYRFVRGMLGNAEDARDVFQNTFLEAARDLRQFDARSSAKAWLFGIANHRCIDAFRLRQRQKIFTLVAFAPETPDQASSAEERFAEKQRLNQLEECMQKLAPHARAAVLLRFVQELSYQEMAEVCGEKPETLRARVSRALPVLRACLEAKGVR